MKLEPHDYMEAARVPLSLEPQEFGMWTVKRVEAANKVMRRLIGWDNYTLLFHLTDASLHQPPGDVVMEDSVFELARHLPIWLVARGRVLITGLGLGCVVRGLLANPDVDHVDVVEIDRQIIDRVGREFVGNARVTIHQGDALTFKWPEGTRWDCAWHDLWFKDGALPLHLAHATLLHEYRKCIPQQGAWQLPRLIKRSWPQPLLGGARR